MHLTTHTDYALRVLITLALSAPGRLTVKELGHAYGASEHHLTKVVQRLAGLGYVATSRGKSGGVSLCLDPSHINLGQVVRETETDLGVVGCLRKEGASCTIDPVCKLKGVLALATERFLSTLDEYTLADVTENEEQLLRLLGVRISRLGSVTAGAASPPRRP